MKDLGVNDMKKYGLGEHNWIYRKTASFTLLLL